MCHLNWLFLGGLAQPALTLPPAGQVSEPRELRSSSSQRAQQHCSYAAEQPCWGCPLTFSTRSCWGIAALTCAGTSSSPLGWRVKVPHLPVETSGQCQSTGGRPIWSFALLRLGMVFDIENLKMRISERKKTFCMEVKHMFISLHISYHQTISKYLSSTWLC